MAKSIMAPNEFDALYCRISGTSSVEEKLCAISSSKGDMTPSQIARILITIPTSPAKVQVINLLHQNRLSRMTCEDACGIIDAIPIHNDKLVVLDMLKRAICDHMNPKGREMLLTAFPYEGDKMKAARILETVQTWATERIPAGGHQGYATVGFLYAQSPPLEQHLYGSIHEQLQRRPGNGKIAVPPQAMTEIYPSMYSSHPSYAYQPPSNYAYVNKMSGPTHWPVSHACGDSAPAYPAGAPPLGAHCGAPPPVGFPGLDC